MGLFMFAHPAAKGGRDTPSPGKVIRDRRPSRDPRAGSQSLMALQDGGEQFSMVHQKSETYRPRRAFIEADAEPDEPAPPTGSFRGNGTAVPPPLSDEDYPKPLFRDQTRTNGRSSPAPRTVSTPPLDPPSEETHRAPTRERWTAHARSIEPPSEEIRRPRTPAPRTAPILPPEPPSEAIRRPRTPAPRTAPIPPPEPPSEAIRRPRTPAPRRTRGFDDETTAILPRSRAGQRHTSAPVDAIDDFDENERNPLGQRTKLALLIGAVAVVVVIGLVIGYAVLGADNQQPQSQPSQPSESSGAGNGPSGNQGQAPSGTALLTDASMLSPDQAKAIDEDRTWKIELTQLTPAEDAPTAACFPGGPLEGQPTPQQKFLRVLQGGSGKKAPTALHEATTYNSPEEATQAYAIASRTLGGCTVTGSYIESGHAVSGVGNQAAGVVVMDASRKQAHSVVLSRTGSVMNILDAAQPSKALAMSAVAEALGQVNSVQCGPAGGECGGTAGVKEGPPPMGGDEPGFLATGDLPPAGAKIAPWVATQVALPDRDFKGSQCENVNWETVSAKSKSSRIYLMQESGANFFGLNEIVLTMKNSKAATKQVGRIKSSLAGCKKTVLTASVTKPDKVTSVGAQNTKIAGWTAVVSQKSTQGTAKYRVGIVSAGPKVIYTFLNPRGDFDFTDRQWDTVAVRAGERASQVT